MGIFDKFKDMVNVPDDDDEDDDDMTPDIAMKNSMGSSNRREPLGDVDMSMTGNINSIRREPLKMSMSGAGSASSSNTPDLGGLQVILVKPTSYEDAKDIADYLGNLKTIVLNLESTEKDTARRIFDFLSGVVYANGGIVERVAKSTFLMTPYSIDFKGGISDEMEGSNIYV